jgi:hypothetical protein
MVTLVNRAKMTTATTGTGTLTLGSAVGGYQSFAAAGVADSNTVSYVIEDGNDWEVGTGVYTASGTTLSRTVSESTAAGSAINLTGNAVVYVSAIAGDIVQPTHAQTLTNKTISYADNTLTGVVGLTATQTLTNKTLTDPAITGTILEDIYTITDGAAFEIDPGNGSIQLITLGANRTPKATNFANGEAVTLMVDDGTAYTLTWTDATFGGSGVVWKTDGGVAPTLNTAGYTVIVLFEVGGQVYGARVGDA